MALHRTPELASRQGSHRQIPDDSRRPLAASRNCTRAGVMRSKHWCVLLAGIQQAQEGDVDNTLNGTGAHTSARFDAARLQCRYGALIANLTLQDIRASQIEAKR